MNVLALIVTLTITSTILNADEIYQYQDKNGTTVYTNKPIKNAKKVILPPITLYASPMTRSDYNAKSYTAANEINNNLKIYTKRSQVSHGTNESGRRQILSEELNHERKGLDDAMQALSAGQQTQLASEKNDPKQYQARIQALQDAITEHQKNIAILSKQLDNDN